MIKFTEYMCGPHCAPIMFLQKVSKAYFAYFSINLHEFQYRKTFYSRYASYAVINLIKIEVCELQQLRKHVYSCC